LTVSRLTADGSLDFSVSLFDIPAGSQWFFFGTMISIYEGSPSVFIPDLPSSSSSGVMRVRTFTVIQPSHAVQEAEITLDITEAMFFYECMLRSISGFLCLGNGVAPGIAVLAGQAFYEDRGIFDWRGEGPAIAKAPAILRLDALSGTSTVIPLAPMDRMSDTLAGLIAVTVVAIAAVVALATGYPFLRARRILKAGQREQMPEAKEPR
jgi:hypothetical protein